MDAIGIVTLVVLAISVIAGVVILREPPDWDQLGGEGPPDVPGGEPSRFDDEAELRALVQAKRAARQAAGGAAVAGDARRATAPPWSHLDAEVLDEARALVARRRARLEREGRPVPDDHEELVRLLGPPQA